MRPKSWIFIAAGLLALAFTFYVWNLYGQLEQAFSQQEEFIPTRIYSDVTRIAPPQPRAQVESRLQSLGYSFQKVEDAITFRMHPVDYPTYLVPEGHPVLNAGNKLITFRFDSDKGDALLQSIQVESNEVAELYLEPELVATLSRGTKQIRELVKWNDNDDNLAMVWKAIIAIEDQHFMDHVGFDPKGLARAVWVNLKTLSFAQGGSTLTQQLVKNLMARRTKNVFRKVNELFLAILLELKFEKTKILERYLNEVYLGQVGSLEIHGVAEGAKHFFGKKLEELNLGEIALMAGLIRGPGYYSPYRYKDRALERQRLVLRKMVETGHIAQAEANAALSLPIRLAPPQTSANKAPYFTDFVKAELIRQLKDRISEHEIAAAGFRVYTTLDSQMNSIAQRAVNQGLLDLEKRLGVPATDRIEGALAAVDHSTGQIRALIGGRSYAQSTFNRILNMRRQVGSTFKPLVYLTAFAKGEDPNGVPYSPAHPVEDGPWKLIYDNKRQTWVPRNYDKEFLGWINYRKALSHSINTVAARLGVEVGIENVIKTARTLGIDSELPNVPSLSLGVAELSPVELVRAYATIANHGVQNELTVLRGITLDDGTGYARFVNHPQQVFPAGPIDLLTDVLQNTFVEGTARAASRMGFDRPAAGKTGTTSHHRDSWFVGYTPHLTAVVWVGMDQTPTAQPSAQPNDPGETEEQPKGRVLLTGASSALPIWVTFMKEALVGEPPTTFPISSHLTLVRTDRYSGKTANPDCPDTQSTVEKFVIGEEPKSSSCETLWPPSVLESTL